ncbi:MAG: hypothetical protein HY907_07910 [Deltaproteobacteria bacterium]|nr:hypothetical protein [Deltaproteobacteria bacterium]
MMRKDEWRWLIPAVLLFVPSASRADSAALRVEGAPAGGFGSWGLLLAVNADDDDENLRLDGRQSPPPAADDDPRLVRLEPPAGTADVALDATGAERIRVHAGGALVALPGSVDAAATALAIDGVRASTAPADVVLRATFRDAAGATLASAELPITVVGIAFLDARNEPVDPVRASLQVSNEITTNDTLPRDGGLEVVSPDPDNFRVEAFLPALPEAVVSVRSAAPGAAETRAELGPLPLAGDASSVRRSPFVRLVADTMDWTAPGVTRQVLLVALRDRVTAVVRAPDGQTATTDLRVGRPGNEDGPQAVRLARWNIHFLRLQSGGPLALGVDEATALDIGRDQVVASNEVYAPCNITFGDPAATTIAFEDPPGPTMLAVGDIDALTSAGGEVRFTVNGTTIGPIRVGANWRPHQTAALIGAVVEAAGFAVEVSENAPVDYGAGRSADVLILDAAGGPVRIGHAGDAPLSTDPRQSLTIGELDLTDRLTEFNNATSSAGTLEERTMYKVLADHDLATIDLFVINRFAGGGRQGEAFIEHDHGTVLNALVLDRTGIRQTRQAWTQSHEAGHVLLDDPYHPDNFGEDRPWLLMDADASLGDVTGPKRLSDEECQRVHRESGIDASPAMLQRWDEIPAEHLAPLDDTAFDPGYPRP